MLTLYTFGDSILDCGGYNDYGVHPGQLLVRNDDRLFPKFRGQDLSSRGPARLVHRAQDGATVAQLPAQARGLAPDESGVAMLTVGGNDLLMGLLVDHGRGVERFAAALDAFLRNLPIRPVLLGNVYDPTFGDDALDFTGVDPRLARENHRRVNAAIAEAAGRYGALSTSTLTFSRAIRGGSRAPSNRACGERPRFVAASCSSSCPRPDRAEAPGGDDLWEGGTARVTPVTRNA